MARNSHPVPQPYNLHPERLSSYKVRASQSFTGGRHYWKVHIPTYPVYFEMKSDDMSWCVEIDGTQINVISAGKKYKTNSLNAQQFTSFGVYLDYDSGVLCLYGTANSVARLLYLFTTNFSKQVLFPVFQVAENTHITLN